MNSSGGEGAEVVYALRNNGELAEGILDSLGEEGQKKRKAYQRRLPTDPSKDYYFIHRLSGNLQPLLIEYGFIDNSKDLSKLQNNLLDYGEAVVRTVADYIGIPYKNNEEIPENVYVVQKGDTLYDIANKYGLTVSELKIANNLTSNLLNVGQKLNIPNQMPIPNTTDYITYIVKKGDTLYSISKEFDIPVNDLINFNQLTTSNLEIGQKILIPINKEETEIIDNYYIIKLGDSLYSIANKYNTTIDELIKKNNLETTILKVGDKLIIPNYSVVIDDNITQDENVYIVQRGDTLYSIANKFDTNVNDLKNINNITNNIISVGQKLVIPSLSTSDLYYVKNGDTLYSIANRFNTTVYELRRINNLSSDLLSIGQVLQLR